MAALLVHYLRAVKFRTTAIFGRFLLRVLGVKFGKNLVLKGLPIINRHRDSSIVFGHDVTLVSASSATALGVNHAVKIETWTPAASITIADDVGISGGSFCAQIAITIGARCLIGANVMIADTDFHPLRVENRRYSTDGVQAAPVVIEDDVFLGADVTVLKGVRIGRNSVIGARSLVTKSIPANAIAAGNPCRVLRFLREEELSTNEGSAGPRNAVRIGVF